MGGKGDAYRYATKAGWGVVEWYSAVNDYKAPVNRDKTDKTQELACDTDCSATLYHRSGREFCIAPYEEINLGEAPTQAETEAIIISGAEGFDFWEHEKGDVKFFVTYDENGLIDTYRLGCWSDKPYDEETEIAFEDLQSEADHDTTDRVCIVGTFEWTRKREMAVKTCEHYEADTEALKEAVDYEQNLRDAMGDCAQEYLDECADKSLCGGKCCKHYGVRNGYPGETLFVCKKPGNEKILECSSAFDNCETEEQMLRVLDAVC
jgi:hypothetical protein